ncbi:MAG: hypothetical protein ACRD2L_06175, partial [Terriglobia bacterium]
MPRCIRGSDIPEVIRETRASSMLYGPALLKNIAFNIASTAFRVPITAIAPVMDVGLRTLSLRNVPKQRFIGESVAHLYGFFHALPLALKTFGRESRNVHEALMQGAYAKAASRAPGTLESTVLKGVGHVASVPFRGLKWTDDFFFNFNYSAQMYRAAYRQARHEGIKGFDASLSRAGLILQEQANEVGALSAKISARVTAQMHKAGKLDPDEIQAAIREALRSESPQGIADARTLAERAIFTNREGKGLDRVLSLLEEIDEANFRAVSIIAPFRRTPANEARELLRASPTGVLNAYQKYKAALDQGLDPNMAAGKLFDDAAQATVGTMALGSLIYAMKGGMFSVTPFYSGKSKALRTVEQAAGESQDSITIGKYNIPARNLGTLGQAILAVEKATREHEQWKATGDKSFLQRSMQWGGEATVGLLAGVADQQFLQNLTELHEAWKNP